MQILAFIFFFISVLSVHAGELSVTADSIPVACSSDCKSEYGSVLGKSPAGVEAYSNCNSNCVIFEPNHYEQIYTGIKWQCVEYARRWLLREYAVVYGDVDIAADIWALQQVSNPKSEQTYKFKSFVNGAKNVPQRGDLLIYSKEFLGTGHVAVVTEIDIEQQVLKIAEQNYANTHWQDDFAREIKYVKHDEGYWLLDAYLIGWKRVEQKTELNQAERVALGAIFLILK